MVGRRWITQSLPHEPHPSGLRGGLTLNITLVRNIEAADENDTVCLITSFREEAYTSLYAPDFRVN